MNASIAVLGLSLVMLVPVSANSQESEQAPQDVVAGIEAAGGRVEHESMDSEKPIVAVSFATQPIGDEALKPLHALTSITKLTLNNTQITDAGLEHLTPLASLKRLYLVDTTITDAGLEHLKSLPGLELLSLVGTKVTDAGLEHVKGMEVLQTIFLAGTEVTDEGVEALKEARPMLEVIR